MSGPQIIAGKNWREQLVAQVNPADSPAIFFVDSALADAPLVAELADQFNAQIVLHQGEPSEAQVDGLAERLRGKAGVPLFLVGGGAVLDAGKAAACIAGGDAGAAHYQLAANHLPKPPGPIIAMPTTSGTGSEVTAISVVSDNAGSKKWLYGAPLVPSLAVLVPELTLSAPPLVKLFCGLDAFVHALEAASGKNNSDQVVALSAQAIPAILDTLADAVAGDVEAAAQMQIASMQAGRAIDMGGTTIGHCLGHALGSVCKVPHGKAVALATEVTLETSMRATPQAFAQIEQAVDRGSILDAWQGLVERLGATNFEFTASTDQAAKVAQAALLPENQPMRNSTQHWFDDAAIAQASEALFARYARAEAQA